MSRKSLSFSMGDPSYPLVLEYLDILAKKEKKEKKKKEKITNTYHLLRFYSSYWLASIFQNPGFTFHLVHFPFGCHLKI